MHTIQRIYGAFPSEQQNNVVICVTTPAIRKTIRDGESHVMVNEIQMGKSTRC